MSKRITRKRRDEMRAEVWGKADRREEPPEVETVVKMLSCGHEEMVSAGLNPEHAICSQH
jgi:hypothetical protein